MNTLSSSGGRVEGDGHAMMPALPRGRPTNPRPPRLLVPYAFAVAITISIALIMWWGMERAAAYDMNGQMELLLPLARLGVLTAPLIVGVRAMTGALVVWLVAGALGDTLTFRVAMAAVLTVIPATELSALINGLALVLRPQAGWEHAHVPIGLDALFTNLDGLARLAAPTINLGLLLFFLLLRSRLLKITSGTVATLASAAAAVLLVLLPLLRA